MDRERRLASSDIYSPFNLAHLFALQHRQRETLKLLRKLGFYPLQDKRILEMGCGRGGVLLEFLAYGATPTYLHGLDLLGDRVSDAHRNLPNLPLVNADGQRLPYPHETFDLVLQYTAFSSVLDDQVKASIAREMLRVVRRLNGAILWYDYWLNPTNPQARGIRPTEIRRLFPGCEYYFRRVTLAPPVVRHLVRVSWLFCSVLEKLKFLNTHYLVLIRPMSD